MHLVPQLGQSGSVVSPSKVSKIATKIAPTRLFDFWRWGYSPHKY